MKIPTLERNEAGIDAALSLLKPAFGDRMTKSRSACEQHGHTTTWLENQPPDAVIFVESAQDVSDIVTICAQHRVPIVPYGTGTSLEGQLNAPAGGVCVDMSRMNRIVEVHPDDLDVVVQPGVTRKQLNDHLRDLGLFFPVDPGADASLGGMAATRASGTNAVRYGTMKDNVLTVQAVMPDGRIVRSATRAKKTSAGYDLTRLLIGSEGTLGIITELTLRLHGIPESIAAGVCGFPSVDAACRTVISTIQYGLPIARIELLDALQMKASNAYSDLNYEEIPTLFLEFHGSEASVREQAESFEDIASDHGGGAFQWATREEDRRKLWQARHDAYWSVLQMRPGALVFSTDVCVPISRLAECVAETQKDIEESGLFAPIVGHVGDGNFHVQPLVDVNSPEEIADCEAFVARVNARAIEMGGTCTGEHGIGQGKMPYLERELGASVDIMRSIKLAIDPLNIMNPGKIMAISSSQM